MTEDKLIKNTEDNATEIEVIEIEGYKIGAYEVEYIERIKGLYGFIYVTTNLVNGKMYVGQRKRTRNWRTYLGSGNALRLAIDKYGRENFTRNIIDIAFSKTELDRLELYYTKLFHAVNHRHWYNICEGGRTGAAEHQKKPVVLYDAYGNYIQKYNSLTQASKLANESRDVVRNSCNGKIIMTKNKNIWRWEGDSFDKYQTTYNKNLKSKVIKCYTFDGKFVCKYDSIHDASNQTNISRSSIKKCCEGLQSTAGGYVWRYEEDDFDKYVVKTKNENIKEKLDKYTYKVKCYTRNGELINIYNSLHEAERETGILRVNISRCCKGEVYTAGNYVWRHIEDNFDTYPYKEHITHKVYCYSLDLKLIGVYQSESDAERKTGYSRSSISRCCKKKQKAAHGLLWFYEDDPDRPH